MLSIKIKYITGYMDKKEDRVISNLDISNLCLAYHRPFWFINFPRGRTIWHAVQNEMGRQHNGALNSIFCLRMRMFNCIKVKYSFGNQVKIFIHTESISSALGCAEVIRTGSRLSHSPNSCYESELNMIWEESHQTIEKSFFYIGLLKPWIHIILLCWYHLLHWQCYKHGV